MGDHRRGVGLGRPMTEPVHPVLHDVDATTRPCRLHRLQRQTHEPLRVTGQMGVVDGRFQVAGGLEPLRSAGVQLGDELGTVLAELGCNIWRRRGW